MHLTASLDAFSSRPVLFSIFILLIPNGRSFSEGATTVSICPPCLCSPNCFLCFLPCPRFIGPWHVGVVFARFSPQRPLSSCVSRSSHLTMTSSLDHLRQQLVAEDLFLVTRLEDDDGALKMVVLKDRTEIPGVPCADTQPSATSRGFSHSHRTRFDSLVFV